MVGKEQAKSTTADRGKIARLLLSFTFCALLL
jgi:hypothetical protein